MNELPLSSPGRTGQAAAPADDAGSDPEVVAAVERACAALRAGTPVLLEGDDGRETLLAAAETLDDPQLDRLARLSGGGPLLLLLTARRAAALGLRDPGWSGDEAAAVSLSAAGCDAARIAALADPTLLPSADAAGLQDLRQAVRQAALAPGLASAAIDLAKLAKLLPAALLAPIGATAGRAAAGLGLPAVSVGAVADYRFASVRSLVRVTEATVPLDGAEDARLVAFRPRDGSSEHLAVVIGAPSADRPVLLRVHSECFTGDLLGSLRCDCGDQLRGAIRAISAEGAGVLLYLSQEGRGIGLVNKLRAYRLQDAGADTAEANEQLGFDADERIYLPAAEMLRQLGFRRVRLLTNNLQKVTALERCGISVEERVPHSFPSNAYNAFYLDTKARRFGHSF